MTRNWSRFIIKMIFFIISLKFENTSAMTISPCENFSYLESTCAASFPYQNLMDKPQYRFINQSLAYIVLSKLDLFEPIQEKYLSFDSKPQVYYNTPYLGLINDPGYCNKSKQTFIENPDIIFNEKNIFLETRSETLAKAVNEIGVDIMPKIGSFMPKLRKSKFKFPLRPDVNVFFTAHSMHVSMHLGQHFGCLTQEVNHIPGHYILKRKDLVAVAANSYAKKFRNRPQCFGFDQYFPKTWLLHDESSCKAFFYQLNRLKHKRLLRQNKIVHIKKIVNSHGGSGVTPLNAQKEQQLIKQYRNGSLCGNITKAIIVQNYILNPLLLENRKFDFRMYMLISSTNPLTVYYHDGFLRVSLYEYDAASDNNQVLLTNLALNKEIYEKAIQGDLYKGMDEEALKHAQQWNFPRFQSYLLSKGIINDTDWLNNYLRPEFKKAMIHLIRMTSHKFIKKSSVYELYGVDFILDTDLKLWFIEANAGPTLSGYSQTLEPEIRKMIKDHFEIVIGLLRSRMKRVILFVNNLITIGDVVETKKRNVILQHKITARRQFREITKNYFEPEFAPSVDNTFQKIIDENLDAKEIYFGLISEECF